MLLILFFPDRAGPGRPHAGPDGPPRAPNTYAGALGPPHMCLYPKTNFIKWIPIKLEKYSFFQKTSSFLVKTKVVELEILYKTGVTRPSNSLSNDSLCSKYFFYNIKKYDFFSKIYFFILSSGALDKSPGVFFDAEFDFNGPGTPGAIK